MYASSWQAAEVKLQGGLARARGKGGGKPSALHERRPRADGLASCLPAT